MGSIERLKIILDAQWKGGSAIGQARQSLTGLDKAATNSKRNWQAMLPGIAAVGVAVGGVAVAARGAWSALEGGAALLETKGKFDRLAESIGTTGDALRTELGDGVGLLMTQAEQMGLATQLMQLGLAKTSEEATRLSAVTGELGIDMGQLALTMTNQTTMRFDQMNMRVDGFKEKVEELKAAGMSADEAFKWAFIQQAEEQVERVGKKSNTTAGKLLMLKNATTQAWETFQQEFATSAVSQLGDIEGAAESAAVDLSALARLLGMLAGGGVGIAQTLSVGVGNLQNIFSGNAERMVWDSESGRYINPNNAMNTVTAGYRAGYPGGAGVGAAASVSAQAGQDLSGQRLAMRDMRQEGLDYVLGLQHANREQEELGETGTRAFGGITSSINEAEQALINMNTAGGDLFTSMFGKKDFNLAEEVFRGTNMSAWDKAQFGIASGLFDEAQANTMLQQTYQMQLAGQLAKAGVGGADIWSQIQGAGGEGLAQEFFKDLDTTITPDIDISQMDFAIDAWAAEKVVVIRGEIQAVSALEDGILDELANVRGDYE